MTPELHCLGSMNTTNYRDHTHVPVAGHLGRRLGGVAAAQPDSTGDAGRS
jgi:hypothetical protein